MDYDHKAALINHISNYLLATLYAELELMRIETAIQANEPVGYGLYQSAKRTIKNSAIELNRWTTAYNNFYGENK